MYTYIHTRTYVYYICIYLSKWLVYNIYYMYQLFASINSKINFMWFHRVCSFTYKEYCLRPFGPN